MNFVTAGVTAQILPAITTIIYVSDTLFLNGTLSGIGGNVSAYSASPTLNHVGATGSGGSGQIVYNIIAASGFSFNWTAASQPVTLNGFGGSAIVSQGGTGMSNAYCNESSSGNNLTVELLKKIIHFGLDISGGNGAILAAAYGGNQPSGQGGGGLYLIAKNIVFNGMINLNGGNGAFYVSSWPSSYVRTGGGGGGSCLLRTTDLIESTGTFTSAGGINGDCGYGLIKGGDGAMVIVTE